MQHASPCCKQHTSRLPPCTRRLNSAQVHAALDSLRHQEDVAKATMAGSAGGAQDLASIQKVLDALPELNRQKREVAKQLEIRNALRLQTITGELGWTQGTDPQLSAQLADDWVAAAQHHRAREGPRWRSGSIHRLPLS